MKSHTHSVSPELLSLLHAVMDNPDFNSFILGGGTSLALRFGHRNSIDIDLFSTESFDSIYNVDLLRKSFPNLEVENRTVGSICANVGSIKLDFLHHPYPLLFNSLVIDNIRMLSLPDLAAMKINAITNRGSKKDFIDLLLLHQEGIPLSKSLDYFASKYGEAGRFLALRSLAWYEDAELEPDPVFLNDWTWKKVRSRMEFFVKEMLKD